MVFSKSLLIVISSPIFGVNTVMFNSAALFKTLFINGPMYSGIDNIPQNINTIDPDKEWPASGIKWSAPGTYKNDLIYHFPAGMETACFSPCVTSQSRSGSSEE